MAFTLVAALYILALILTAVLIFFAIFHIIAFDELKTDYKNPIDQCNSLNPLVLPEYFIHIFYNCLFLFAFEWVTVLLNAPLILYHIRRIDPNRLEKRHDNDCCQINFASDFQVAKQMGMAKEDVYDEKFVRKTKKSYSSVLRWYSSRPVMSSPGLYDPTTIMNADELNRAMREGWIKLAFYLISFFYYLYSMIYTLVSA